MHSPGEFQDVLHMNPGSLVVLMCKAQVRWEGTGLLHEPGEPDGAGVQCTVHRRPGKGMHRCMDLGIPCVLMCKAEVR